MFFFLTDFDEKLKVLNIGSQRSFICKRKIYDLQFLTVSIYRYYIISELLCHMVLVGGKWNGLERNDQGDESFDRIEKGTMGRRNVARVRICLIRA